MNFSPYLATQLIELEKHCADLQERDRQEYEELISSRNRSRIFKYLKSFQKEIPTKNCTSWLEFRCTKQQRKSRIVQHVFLISSYWWKLWTEIDAPPLLDAAGQKINFTEKEITIELEMLVVTKCRGADGIPPILLKKTANTVSKSFKSLFNNIGRLHNVPGSWKHGLVSQYSKMVIRVKWKIIDLSHCSTSYPKFLRY